MKKKEYKRKTNKVRWYEKFIGVDFGEEYGYFVGTAWDDEYGKMQYEFSNGYICYYQEAKKIFACMNEAIKNRKVKEVNYL